MTKLGRDKTSGRRTYECPKCGAVSGDNWVQCEGKCPLRMSPHYDETIARSFGYPDPNKGELRG